MSLLGHDKRMVKSWKAAPEEMSLEATAKDGQWRCWRDVLGKTVPDMRGGNWKSPVTDGWQPRTVDNQWRCRAGTQTMSYNRQIRKYNTKIKCNIHLYQLTTSAKLRSVSHKAAVLWNEPLTLKRVSSSLPFERNPRIYLLSLYSKHILIATLL